MVRYLLKHPVSLLTSFVGLLIVGVICFFKLPVSLLPDIPVPHIGIVVQAPDFSAAAVDQLAGEPLRRNMMQVNGVKSISSTAREGQLYMNLSLEYGADADLIFIEANEKLDAASAAFPAGINRPAIFQGNPTDIPVFYVAVRTRSSRPEAFREMCELSQNIIRRRLEQLPSVAMADISGCPSSQWLLKPRGSMLQEAGITAAELSSALAAHNIESQSVRLQEGAMQYEVYLPNPLGSREDLENMPIEKNGRIYRLADLFDISLSHSTDEAREYYCGDPAVSMAIIKKSDAKMDGLETEINEALDSIAADYPEIVCNSYRNQSQLLEANISNLEQDLVAGIILVFGVCLLFMHSVRMPVIIGLTVLVSVVLSFLVFYLAGMSVNIISIAGLMLAVGMMIDNSLIVAENITQHRARGEDLMTACVRGTSEMFTPLLSSTLTTVAVFVPLVFMSGIAGAIFMDQALSISIGLGVSYLVGITLLPSLYFLLCGKVESRPGRLDAVLVRWYDRGVDFTFAHKKAVLIATGLVMLLIYPLWLWMDTERMPDLREADAILKIQWPQEVGVDENARLSLQLMDRVAHMATEYAVSAGPESHARPGERPRMHSEAEIYMAATDAAALDALKDSVKAVVHSIAPGARYRFIAPDNVFERVFASEHESPLELRLKDGAERLASEAADSVAAHIAAMGFHAETPDKSRSRSIELDAEAAARYGIAPQEVARALRSALQGTECTVLHSADASYPVMLAPADSSLAYVLENTQVSDRRGEYSIPLSRLVRLHDSYTYAQVEADGNSAYVPVSIDCDEADADSLIPRLKAAVRDSELLGSVCGNILDNRELVHEMLLILAVSLVLMYFILCAQFESFLQPLIVLTEIPVDIAFALLSLKLCGETLNLMSLIGIIVTCGIVVNDSILKIDAINELRKEGMPVEEAIHMAGQRRLKAIIMTSLTTVLATVPVLFTSGLGSQLQQPMAIAMAGSMIPGTIVSIFVIPLIYSLICVKKS